MSPRDDGTIEPADWEAFLLSLGARHRNSPVTVEVIGTELGAQTGVRELPFEGITLERKGAGAPVLLVMAGNRRHDHLTHSIAAPERLRVESSPSGETLCIESADGVVTLIRFAAAEGKTKKAGSH
jgi:hypothetical protein